MTNGVYALKSGEEYTPELCVVESKEIALHIVGANGKLGKDLGKLAIIEGFTIEPDPDDADFVALCTPSHVSQTIIERGTYDDKITVDLSGAAKQNNAGQYGLMRDNRMPWDKKFNISANLYGNPGCIASAVIKGLGKAGLVEESLPQSLEIFSVGGQTHTQLIEQDELKLARRLNSHPHTDEIEQAFGDNLHITSFMPAICDVSNGLLVSMHGKTRYRSGFDEGADRVAVSDVINTSLLKHRLELPVNNKTEGELVDFSLAVVLDNLRFVTNNALQLMRYIARHR